jgi:caffeoyl-CoA O-methyltransferase
MSSSSYLPPAIVDYLAAVNPPEHPALARCREETTAHPLAIMQISAEQGAFMAHLARLIAARRAFEVGVFTGYSALAVVLAMRERHGPDAHLLGCDISADWTAKAREYWKAADVDQNIDLRIAPALETLDHLIAEGQAGAYDFGFIDADKTGYDAYYERGLTLLRAGGLMLFDNVLWSGKVADADAKDEDTVVLRDLAFKAKNDPRVDAAMVAIGDGLLMVIKR